MRCFYCPCCRSSFYVIGPRGIAEGSKLLAARSQLRRTRAGGAAVTPVGRGSGGSGVAMRSARALLLRATDPQSAARIQAIARAIRQMRRDDAQLRFLFSFRTSKELISSAAAKVGGAGGGRGKRKAR